MVHPRLQVGLISDTHGLLRPEATAALRGSKFIVHAGDIGDSSILDRLSKIAPTPRFVATMTTANGRRAYLRPKYWRLARS
jgi:predicted phosphodiesterase